MPDDGIPAAMAFSMAPCETFGSATGYLPTTTRHMPPTPPARNDLSADAGFATNVGRRAVLSPFLLIGDRL